MVDIRITYETLFDLLRREKNREELQALDPDFYEQVTAYLKEKESVIRKKEDSLFASAEREKLKIQFQNIRRIIKELYERREKKIINIALMRARTGSDIIDTSSFLLSERDFFEELVILFSKYKDDVLIRIINLKDELPGSFAAKSNAAASPGSAARNLKDLEPSAQKNDFASDDEEGLANHEEDDFHFNVKDQAGDNGANRVSDNVRKIKIKDYLPQFMGKQGEVLGPFNKDDVVELDLQVAELLMKKGRAETV